MDKRMSNYLQYDIESLLDIRKALTAFQSITPSADMVCAPYYASLCSIGRKDLVDAILARPTEAFRNIEELAALKKLVEAARKQLNVSIVNNSRISSRLCAMLSYIKVAKGVQHIAADISEIQAEGYAAILNRFADSSNIRKLKKYKNIVIPVLNHGKYTGTSISVVYTEAAEQDNKDNAPAGITAFILQQEEAYASVSLAVIENSPFDILLKLRPGIEVNGLVPAITSLHYTDDNAHIKVMCQDKSMQQYTGRTAAALMEFYALIHLVLSQLDEVKECTIQHKDNKPKAATVHKQERSEFYFVPVVRYKYAVSKKCNEGEKQHHSSPREHERSGHYRHYKSGKVVYIHPTTVNKGHEKVIYRASKHYEK